MSNGLVFLHVEESAGEGPFTGGIAEAFYGGVPEAIAQRVTHNLPKVFYQILDAMKEETSYGRCSQITRSRSIRTLDNYCYLCGHEYADSNRIGRDDPA